MAFSKVIITDGGKNLLNTSILSGQKVIFTKAVTSDEKYTMEELAKLSDLQAVQTVPIKNVKREDGYINLTIEFDNAELTEGYLVQTLGIYAKLEESAEEVLFAALRDDTESTYIPSKDITASGLNFRLKLYLENAENIKITIDPAGVATLADVQLVEDQLTTHENDNVKHITSAERESWNSSYEQSTAYTDQKIAGLINGAPETLDTLKEVADAIEENRSVEEALNSAIGTKANQSDLSSHTGNSTIHVTSLERTKWNNAANATDELTSTLLSKIYPVGSIYMSTNSTSPATFIGGTWQRIQDRFLLAAGSTYTAGNTGGSSTTSYTPSGSVGYHTLTTSEMPSHTHTFTGSSVSTSIEDTYHAHTFTSTNTALNHYHDFNTGGQSQGHTHNTGFKPSADEAGGYGLIAGGAFTNRVIVSQGTYSTTGTSNDHTHSGTTAYTDLTHKHSGTTNAENANHAHTVTASGSNSNAGGGSSHNHSFSGTAANISTMSPYLTVYMWKRTA